MPLEYEYLQQRAYLDVDVLGKKLSGVSEVVLAPKDAILSPIRLHARQMTIKSVCINNIETTFELLDFLGEIVEESYRDLAAFDLFYRGAIIASKEGELIIHLPPSLTVLPSNHESNSDVKHEKQANHINPSSADNKEKDSEPHNVDSLPTSSTGYEPIVIRIEYEVVNPKGGLRFVVPNESFTSESTNSPHMYTYSPPLGGLCDGARTWLPCYDVIREKCLFRLSLTVPNWCVAVASGQMVRQTIDMEANTRTFNYVVNTRTSCSLIGFAVGPFRLYSTKENPNISHFALPEVYDNLIFSCYKLEASMKYFEEEFNAKYPYKTYQQIFVQDPPEELQYYGGCAIMDQSFLHGPSIIDRNLSSHLTQVKAFVGSWIAGAIGIYSTRDAWVLIGIIGHLVNTYVRSTVGDEEYGYRIQLAMDALTTIELTEERATALISSEVNVFAEYHPNALAFLEIKAPLILHMIEQRVGIHHLKIAMQRVIAGACGLDSITTNDKFKHKDSLEPQKTSQVESNTQINPRVDVVRDRADDGGATMAAKSQHHELLSTLTFLKTVKAIAGAPGQDLTKSFLATWIVQPSLPFFTVGYWYNRKQTQAEIVLQQEVPPGGKKYTGPISITIVEDTSEYTYHKRVENLRHKWDFPCHGKVRKKRRKRQGFDDPDESISVTGAGMGLNDTPVFWVKVDTGCSWLRHIVMHQPDFNWMEQLLSDKKVGSRVAAARSLALFPLSHEKPNVMSCRVLTECMSGLTTHSRRLRAEATLSLGIWQSIHAPLTNANTSLSIWKGMHNLFRIFKEHFYNVEIQTPLPNYFLPSGGKVVMESLNSKQNSNSFNLLQVQEYAAGEYELKKTVPRALAQIKAQNGRSPPEIQDFLMELLRYNDNSKNYITMADTASVADDCFYIGHIVLALSHLCPDPSVASLQKNTDQDVVAEILRYLNYDQVQRSYQQIVTICCLEALCNLILTGRCDSKVVDFHAFVHPMYDNGVRKTAIESILRLYFAEDSTRSNSFHSLKESEITSDVIKEVYGPPAGLLWLIDFLKVSDESPNLKLFAVEIALLQFQKFPPRVSTEVLATWDHAYTLGVMGYIQFLEPGFFLLSSPAKQKQRILECFSKKTNVKHLHDDSVIAVKIVNDMWELMNHAMEMNQKLRIALMDLYRQIWGDDTPVCVKSLVLTKSKNWAGGYERIRILMNEAKQMEQERYKAKVMELSNSDRGVKRLHGTISRSPSPMGNTDQNQQSQTNRTLDQLKGKKIKFKIGEKTFRSLHHT